MRNPRSLFWLIITLTIVAVFINLPVISNIKFGKSTFNFDPNIVFKKLNITQQLTFRRGLDLKGGTSLVLKAEMNNIPSAQRSDALNSAKIVIENRVNLFGVSEPLVQTLIAGNNDYRFRSNCPA